MYRTVKRWTVIVKKISLLAFLKEKAREVEDEMRPYLKIWKITQGSIPAWVRVKKELLESSPKYFLLSIAYMEEIDGERKRKQYRIDVLPAPTKESWEDFLSHVGACSEWREILSRPVVFCLEETKNKEIKKFKQFKQLIEQIKKTTSLPVEDIVFIILRDSIREELIREARAIGKETVGETIKLSPKFVIEKLKEGAKIEELINMQKAMRMIER